eukprot:6181128-Pleurochrysis_carterae.AAC.1
MFSTEITCESSESSSRFCPVHFQLCDQHQRRYYRLGRLRLEREPLSERSGKCTEARGEHTLLAAASHYYEGKNFPFCSLGQRGGGYPSTPTATTGGV